jgi:hypothetical protein
MLIFRSEDMIDTWCKRTGKPRGAVLTIPQTWKLSRLWYSNRLSPDFHGRSAQQAEELFREARLTSKYWYA